jgi:hypothetical protein
MEDILNRCAQCNSPVTDSIEVEIENHGRVKFGKNTGGSWICSDCDAQRSSEANSTIQDDSSSILRHEHISAANKSDVSPNTPPADEFEM